MRNELVCCLTCFDEFLDGHEGLIMTKSGNHDANDWLCNESSGSAWNGAEPLEIRRDLAWLFVCLLLDDSG